jgi:membrane protein DedA with SNARE-associated domain/membrane-associated phospholipid phosphatase
MERLLHLILGSAQAHPQLALVIVGFVACAESLPIVGTLVPAAVVMFAGGALAAQGVLGLGPTLLIAVAGAVAGDALSFELGRRAPARMRRWPVYQRHLAAVRGAQAFIHRHGALSVVLARFIGPVRAFVPLLAGLGHMPRTRFYVANVASALVWAPVHLLPGVVFGGSLQVAEAISGRLAAMILLLAGMVALAIWLVTRGLRWLAPQARHARALLLGWAAPRSGRLPKLVTSLLDPERPGSPALLLGSIVLIGAGWLFLGLLQDVVAGDPMVQVDQAVHAFFQALRTQPVDRAMVVVTEMGSAAVLLPLVAVAAAWLLARGSLRTLGYWISSVAVAELLVKVLKLTLGRQRPGTLYTGVESFSFPSGHATMSTVVLGFLAFLLVRSGSAAWRSFVLAVTAACVVLVAVSRLYLGAHWLSDVLAGMSLGLLWVAFCAMVYTRRHVAEALHARQLAALIAVTVIGATAAWHRYRGAADLAFYAPSPQAPSVVGGGATATGWPAVPHRRREFGGDLEERFTLQWACPGPRIEQALHAAGWQAAAPWSLRSALAALSAGQALVALPVLPRFDRGAPSAWSFVRSTGPAQRQVLRLWRASVDVRAGDMLAPVWYGALYDEGRRPSGLFKGWIMLAHAQTTRDELERAIGLPLEGVLARRSDAALLLECG